MSEENNNSFEIIGKSRCNFQKKITHEYGVNFPLSYCRISRRKFMSFYCLLHSICYTLLHVRTFNDFRFRQSIQ